MIDYGIHALTVEAYFSQKQAQLDMKGAQSSSNDEKTKVEKLIKVFEHIIRSFDQVDE